METSRVSWGTKPLWWREGQSSWGSQLLTAKWPWSWIPGERRMAHTFYVAISTAPGPCSCGKILWTLTFRREWGENLELGSSGYPGCLCGLEFARLGWVSSSSNRPRYLQVPDFKPRSVFFLALFGVKDASYCWREVRWTKCFSCDILFRFFLPQNCLKLLLYYVPTCFL